jgi:hypothetical protein
VKMYKVRMEKTGNSTMQARVIEMWFKAQNIIEAASFITGYIQELGFDYDEVVLLVEVKDGKVT